MAASSVGVRTRNGVDVLRRPGQSHKLATTLPRGLYSATMATKKKSTRSSRASASKKGQTPAERAKITAKLMRDVRALLKPIPVDVLGHIETAATCCRNGTVALIKVEDRRINPSPKRSRK